MKQTQTHTVRCYLGRDDDGHPKYGNVEVEVEVDFRALAEGHAYRARKNKSGKSFAAGRAVKVTHKGTLFDPQALVARPAAKSATPSHVYERAEMQGRVMRELKR